MSGSDGALAGRVALITGASHGIGRAVAQHFAVHGAELILVARTRAALEETDDAVRGIAGRAATLVPADLRDGAAIDQMGAAVYARWGRLDVLVGNAALLGTLTPLAHIEPAAWDEVLAVNLTANFRLLRSFDPLLRASAAGRAIFVTAGVAPGRAYWGGYAASKAALEAMVRGYAEEVAHTGVRANLLDPGATRTQIRAAAFPAENPASVKTADDPRLMQAFLALAVPACQSAGECIRVSDEH